MYEIDNLLFLSIDIQKYTIQKAKRKISTTFVVNNITALNLGYLMGQKLV